jgi:hypothetical protein
MQELDIETKSAYDALRGQLIHASAIWQVYQRSISWSGPATLMNQVAPGYFNVSSKCMLRAILLLIRNLLDPPESPVKGVKRRNASLAGLLLGAFGPSYATVSPELVAEIDYAKIPKILALWVNRYIAHNDWAAVVGTEPLPNLQPDEIIIALGAVEKFMSMFGSRFGLNTSFEIEDGNLVDQLAKVEEALRSYITHA